MSVSSTISAFPAARLVTEVSEPIAPGVQSDHTLMLGVRDGDIARLGELFERHHGNLFGFFVRLTHDRAGSEDLVQLVFYRILRYRHTYRDVGSFTAWMYHIARRALADYRRHAVPIDAVAGALDMEILPDHAPHSAEAAAASDDARLLHRAIAALDEDDQELLVMARFQELPYSEIAEILKITTGAVKVRVHRAMHQLRQSYLQLSRGGGPVARTSGASGGPG